MKEGIVQRKDRREGMKERKKLRRMREHKKRKSWRVERKRIKEKMGWIKEGREWKGIISSELTRGDRIKNKKWMESH